MSSTTPLYLPESQPPDRSWIERTCSWIPIGGWVIANELWKRRISASLESLAQQLATRSEQVANVNTLNDSRTRVAVFVARTVKDLFGWPNDHFIADDPFNLMLFGDEGAGIEVINAIEDYLGLPRETISNEQLENISRMTFGQVVDFFVALSKRDNPQSND